MTIRNDATRLEIRLEDPRTPRSVVPRQGQVLLETDLDQQARELLARIEFETVDVLGSPSRFVYPAGTIGFKVAAATPLSASTIAAGHGYLAGWLVECSAACTLATQPHPRGNDTVAGAGILLLKALIRYVDPVEEPALADKALGDAQASGRSLVDWQVLPCPAAAGVSCDTSLSDPTWQKLVAPSTGTLAVIKQTAAPSTDVCSLTPAGGYTRLENLLYRLEVHDGTPLAGFPDVDGPRFQLAGLKLKLSRRNASVLARITHIDDHTITVAPPALDPRNWFAPGAWAEIVSIHDDLDPDKALQNARLFRVSSTSDDTVTLEATAAAIALTGASESEPWFLRLWDAFPDGKEVATVVVDAGKTESNVIDLGDGLSIQLGNGANATFRRGDYWTCAARADGSIDWPLQGGVPAQMTPHGPLTRYAPLATFGVAKPEDCRIPFASLTDRLLLYRGGDGQTVTPNPLALGAFLPLPALPTVGVTRGETPVNGAKVRFTVIQGNGKIAGPAEVTTLADGLATCDWQLDSTTPTQQLQAELLDKNGVAQPLPVTFTATLNTAANVAYTPGCTDLSNVITVQEALDELCRRKSSTCCCKSVGEGGDYATAEEALKDLVPQERRPFCLCFLPGSHEWPDIQLPPALTMTLSGVRGASTLVARTAFKFSQFTTLTVEDLILTSDGPFEVAGAGDLALSFVSITAKGHLRVARSGSVSISDTQLRLTGDAIFDQLRSLSIARLNAGIEATKDAFSVRGAEVVHIEASEIAAVLQRPTASALRFERLDRVHFSHNHVISAQLAPPEEADGGRAELTLDGLRVQGRGVLVTGRLKGFAHDVVAAAFTRLPRTQLNFAEELAAAPAGARQERAEQLRKALTEQFFELGVDERHMLQDVHTQLKQPRPEAEAIAIALGKLGSVLEGPSEPAPVKVVVGQALVLEDGAGFYHLDGNTFEGIVGLYGNVGPTGVDQNTAEAIDAAMKRVEPFGSGMLHFTNNDVRSMRLAERFLKSEQIIQDGILPVLTFNRAHIVGNSFFTAPLDGLYCYLTFSNNFVTAKQEYGGCLISLSGAFTSNVAASKSPFRIISASAIAVQSANARVHFPSQP